MTSQLKALARDAIWKLQQTNFAIALFNFFVRTFFDQINDVSRQWHLSSKRQLETQARDSSTSISRSLSLVLSLELSLIKSTIFIAMKSQLKALTQNVNSRSQRTQSQKVELWSKNYLKKTIMSNSKRSTNHQEQRSQDVQQREQKETKSVKR